jgi:hypothetical protein
MTEPRKISFSDPELVESLVSNLMQDALFGGASTKSTYLDQFLDGDWMWNGKIDDVKPLVDDFSSQFYKKMTDPTSPGKIEQKIKEALIKLIAGCQGYVTINKNQNISNLKRVMKSESINAILLGALTKNDSEFKKILDEKINTLLRQEKNAQKAIDDEREFAEQLSQAKKHIKEATDSAAAIAADIENKEKGNQWITWVLELQKSHPDYEQKIKKVADTAQALLDCWLSNKDMKKVTEDFEKAADDVQDLQIGALSWKNILNIFLFIPSIVTLIKTKGESFWLRTQTVGETEVMKNKQMLEKLKTKN